MKKRYLLLCLLSCLHFVLQGQTIGIIGNATASGWAADIDLKQDAVDPEKWSAELSLDMGECKFRRDDNWDVNWGATDFPMGKAELNGSNIIVENPATYFIEFNSGSGEYRFINTSEIGLIGSATPFGNSATTDLIQDPINPNLYTRTLELQAGSCRFQA
jgi:hypothetical protein